MAEDSIKHQHAVSKGAIPTRLVIFLVCAAGLLCVICAVLTPGLEWRVLAMAALAAAVSPFVVEVRARSGTQSIRLSLTHSTLFAGVLALGPLGASLPAVFGAAARLISEPPGHKALHRVIYAIVKPAVVCSCASLAYVGAGGNVLRPQQVDSFAPLILAGIVYVAANALLAGTEVESRELNTDTRPRALSVMAGWSLCVVAGYALAVLYAIAPAYVLLALAAPAALAAGTLLATPKPQVHRVDSEPETEIETKDSDSIFTDPATGLANRRYLEMFLKNELSRSERADRPLSIAIFDLDDFKNARDGTDNAAGESLMAMGESLKSAIRDYDLVAAYSPTRLVVVLPEASAPEAEEIASRLHRSVTSVRLRGKPISVSVGISTFPDHGSTVEDLINASHRALNQGRFLGPNRVHSCCEMPKAS
ncbi:MAG: GGDEF domain-containing protein [Armatimonadota bacterium]